MCSSDLTVTVYVTEVPKDASTLLELIVVVVGPSPAANAVAGPISDGAWEATRRVPNRSAASGRVRLRNFAIVMQPLHEALRQ